MSSFTPLDEFIRELDEAPFLDDDQLSFPFDDEPVPADVLKDMDFINEEEMDEDSFNDGANFDDDDDV